MNLNLKSLVSKLTPTARRGLEGAAGLCLSRTHYEVEMEHWLATLAEPADADINRILRHFGAEPDRFLADIDRALDTFRTGNGGRPQLAPSIEDLVREAWVYASINLGAATVRSGALLAAALSDRNLRRRLVEVSRDLDDINLEALTEELPSIVAGSPEDAEMFAGDARPTGDFGAGDPAAAAGTQALDRFTVDLTADARGGRIDPILGRDHEIRQIVDILTRRRQNNPILTGEAGVGKTAVVEGFALRIASGDVPEPLKNVAVRTLDLGLLQAGAGVKGEFENRLKDVIKEVQGSAQPIILFIDEAHTLIGAGGQEGQNDAANLLKPALARGDLRTVAATTWAEYKRYFEKDPALTRRFQVVKIEEPDETKAIEMMRALAPKLEQHHGVRILDEAVQESVRLSHRYIPARQLPDKSVSVLDTSCARVAIGRGSTPPAVEDLRREIDGLAREERILRRETAVGADHAERLGEIEAQREKAAAELAELEERWEREGELVEQILTIHHAVEAAMRGESGDAEADGESGESGESDESDESAETPAATKEPAAGATAEQRAELDKLKSALAELQGESPLVEYVVDGQAVAEVISGWTGIPVGRMVADEIQTVLELPNRLGARVIGQDHALEAIGMRIRTARAGLDNPSRPIGVFMLVGPSGVGKTESALSLAETLYGGERNLVTINMSEYQESHTVSSLKGSPPGYVGYGEGGVLTEAVRRRPYSVVLLDEVEKAHPDVMELFFQVFDKGILEDGEGREIDFKNTVILLTSNVGSDTIMTLCNDPELLPTSEALAEAIRPELLDAFPAALLGRMVVVPFFPLQGEAMTSIIRLQLDKIRRRMARNHRVTMEYGDELVAAVAARCTESASGARNIDRILTQSLLPEISAEFLSRMATGEPFSRVEVTVADGAFTYEVS